MNNIMVTVYCTTYNHEKYIRDALDGFVMQETNFQFEVLVHDDASTDGTAKIIKEYEEKYPSIIRGIYQKENLFSKKVDRTYKFMLPATNGKYIALCEGDDYWTDKKKLQAQVDYMESHPECSLVAHEAIISIESTGEEKRYTNYDFHKNGEISVDQIINDQWFFPTASMMFAADFFYRNKEFLTTHPYYDYLLKIMLAIEGKIYVIPRVMSVYRMGTSGSWTNRVANNNEKYIKHEEVAVRNLLALDEYSDYKYHKQLYHAVLKRKFHIEQLKGNYSKLRKPPYRDIYRDLKLKRRVAIRIKEFSPNLFAWIRKHIVRQ